MNIIQQPDMLSLSMNLKNFIIGSSRQTTFTLRPATKNWCPRYMLLTKTE